jgi:hypothetical protein
MDMMHASKVYKYLPLAHKSVKKPCIQKPKVAPQKNYVRISSIEPASGVTFSWPKKMAVYCKKVVISSLLNSVI